MLEKELEYRNRLSDVNLSELVCSNLVLYAKCADVLLLRCLLQSGYACVRDDGLCAAQSYAPCSLPCVCPRSVALTAAAAGADSAEFTQSTQSAQTGVERAESKV